MVDLSAGVPGVNAPPPSSFEEFWPYYVSQHLRPLTRTIHVWSTVTAFVIGAAALAAQVWWVAPVAVGTAYGMNWGVHLAWERNRPASWGSPWWSFQGDMRLVRRYFSRDSRSDVEAVRAAVGLHPEHRCLADAPHIGRVEKGS